MSYCPNCRRPIHPDARQGERCGADFSGEQGWGPTDKPVEVDVQADGVQIAGRVVFVGSVALLAWLASFGNIYLFHVMAAVGVVALGAALFAFSPRRRKKGRSNDE